MSTEDLLFEGSGQTETEARGLAAKQFLDHIYQVRTQWGSEYQTCSVFIWSKKKLDAAYLVFKCHLNTRQPDYLNTRQMEAILFSYVLVRYLNGWSST